MADKPFTLNLPELPPEEKSTWEKANTPLADLRHSNPTMAVATDQFQKDHPWLGGAANAVLDTVSSMSSPIALGLGAVTGGAGLLEKTGLGSAIPVLHKVMKAGAAGMVGHGGYKVATGETPYDKIGGAIEAGMGGLGLMAGPHGAAPESKPNYTTQKGLRVAYDALKNNPKPVNPGDPGYADFKAMHEAIDAHTLHNPKGPMAVHDIYGKEGRPDSYMTDPRTGRRVSRGLSLVDAEKAHGDALNEAAKDLKTANAVEQAKGAPSKAVREELELKKPILDLIEASRSRMLTNDELKLVSDEVKKYPKGVVQKAVDTLKKNATDLNKSQDLATKQNASNVTANMDVKQGQIDRLNEEAANQAAATKPMEAAQAKAEARTNAQASKGFTEANRDTQNLADVEDWRNKQDLAKLAAQRAQAQQDALDAFKKRSDVVAGPQSARSTQTGVGPNGEKESLSQSYRVVPPDPEDPDLSDLGAGGAPPDDDSGGSGGTLSKPTSQLPTSGFKGKKQAIAAADAAGGPGVADVKYNPHDGLHYVVPKGGDVPAPPVMQPGLERDSIRGRTFNKRTDAEAIAKFTGGTVHRDGPRGAWSVRFADEELPIASSTPTAPASTEPTPIQKWDAGGPPPERSSSSTYVEDPANHEVKPFDTGSLSPDEFRRMKDIEPGINIKRTPEERAEYLDLFKRSKQPKSSVSADVTDYTGGDVPTTDVEPPAGNEEGPFTTGASEPVANAQANTPPSGPEFEAFAKQYQDHFKKLMSYSPNEAGSGIYANKMAELANAHPDWADHLEGSLDTPSEPPPPPAEEPPAPAPVPVAPQPPSGGAPSAVDPYVNPKGEAELTLPGMEPMGNPPAAPIAEAPFGLTQPAKTPKPLRAGALPMKPVAPVTAKGAKLAESNLGADSLDFLADAHGGELPADLNPIKNTGGPLTPEELKSAKRRQGNEARRRQNQAPLLAEGGALPEVPSVEDFAADTKNRGEDFNQRMADSKVRTGESIQKYRKILVDAGKPEAEVDALIDNVRKTHPDDGYVVDALGQEIRKIGGTYEFKDGGVNVAGPKPAVEPYEHKPLSESERDTWSKLINRERTGKATPQEKQALSELTRRGSDDAYMHYLNSMDNDRLSSALEDNRSPNNKSRQSGLPVIAKNEQQIISIMKKRGMTVPDFVEGTPTPSEGTPFQRALRGEPEPAPKKDGGFEPLPSEGLDFGGPEPTPVPRTPKPTPGSGGASSDFSTPETRSAVDIIGRQQGAAAKYRQATEGLHNGTVSDKDYLAARKEYELSTADLDKATGTGSPSIDVDRPVDPRLKKAQKAAADQKDLAAQRAQAETAENPSFVIGKRKYSVGSDGKVLTWDAVGKSGRRWAMGDTVEGNDPSLPSRVRDAASLRKPATPETPSEDRPFEQTNLGQHMENGAKYREARENLANGTITPEQFKAAQDQFEQRDAVLTDDLHVSAAKRKGATPTDQIVAKDAQGNEMGKYGNPKNAAELIEKRIAEEDALAAPPKSQTSFIDGNNRYDIQPNGRVRKSVGVEGNPGRWAAGQTVAGSDSTLPENVRTAAKAIKSNQGPDLGQAPKQAQAQAGQTAADYAREMAELRDKKPRPIDKLYGKNGPTPAQAEEHAAAMRDWNNAYKHASARQKSALLNESLASREVAKAPEAPVQGGAAPVRVVKSAIKANPEGIYEPTPSLEDARATYGRIKAAKEAGQFIPDEVRSAAGEELQNLEKGAQAPKAEPQVPAEPASKYTPEEASMLKEVQDGLKDPNTSEVEKTMLKRWIDKFMEEKGELNISWKRGQPNPNAPGAVPEGLLEKSGDFLNRLRRSTLLNPYSVLKKGIGDAQAIGTGMIKHPGQAGDMMKSLFSPETWENVKAGWDAPSQTMEGDNDMAKLFTSKKNLLSWSGRAMSGMTNATKGVLMDAGLTPEEAQALTLTKTPSRPITGGLYRLLNEEPILNHLSPFSRIALNWVEQGLEHSPVGLADLITKRGQLAPEEIGNIWKKAALGTGAGALAYAATPDNFVKEHPMAARMMTAGPLGLPILAGMAMKNQRSDSALPVGETLTSLLDELPGMRLTEDIRNPRGFARNYISSYTNFAKPAAEALDPEEKDLYSKDLSLGEKLTNKAIANIPIARSTLPGKPEPPLKLKF